MTSPFTVTEASLTRWSRSLKFRFQVGEFFSDACGQAIAKDFKVVFDFVDFGFPLIVIDVEQLIYSVGSKVEA